MEAEGGQLKGRHEDVIALLAGDGERHPHYTTPHYTTL